MLDYPNILMDERVGSHGQVLLARNGVPGSRAFKAGRRRTASAGEADYCSLRRCQITKPATLICPHKYNLTTLTYIFPAHPNGQVIDGNLVSDINFPYNCLYYLMLVCFVLTVRVVLSGGGCLFTDLLT